MKENYFRYLVESFVKARGIKEPNISSHEFISEFYEWVKERRLLGLQYTYFLDHLGFSYQEASCVEVGKTNYDSVVLPFETLIISPVASSFDFMHKQRVIEGKMKVLDNVPMLERPSKPMVEIPEDEVTTFMTQNPFSFSHIRDWENLHNSGRSNIILGVYGSILDKDANSKLRQMDVFKSNLLTDDYVSEYASLGDTYFYAVGSNRNIKRLNKTL